MLPRRLTPVAAAAAAIFLLMLGLQFLGDGMWKGGFQYESPPVRVNPGGEDTLITASMEGLPPGIIFQLLPGQTMTVELDERGSFEVLGPALFAMGSPDGDRVVSLARGIIRATPLEGANLSIDAGGYFLRPQGSIDIEVSDVLPTDARNWVIAQSRMAILGEGGAHADSPLDCSVEVAAVNGTVTLPGNLLLASGREISRGPAGGWDSPRRLEPGRYEAARILTRVEADAVSELLSGGKTPVEALVSAMSSDELPPWKRGLATWLLGELGDKRAVPPLIDALDRTDRHPPVVRAATVRSLALLGAASAVLATVDDPDQAVAETAVDWIRITAPVGAREVLRRVASDPGKPPFLRALASAAIPTDHLLPAALLDLLGCKDPDVRRITARLTRAGFPGDTEARLAELASVGDIETRCAAFDALGQAYSESAKAAALEAATHEDNELQIAALRYLTLVFPEESVRPNLEAFRDVHTTIRRAALNNLAFRSTLVPVPLNRNDRAELILLAEDFSQPSEVRVDALTLLVDESDLWLSLLVRAEEDAFRAGILSLCEVRGIWIDPTVLQPLADDASDAQVQTSAWKLLMEAEEQATLERLRARLRTGDLAAPVAIDVMEAATSDVLESGNHDLAVDILRDILLSSTKTAYRVRAAGRLASYASNGSRGAIDAIVAACEPSAPDPVRRAAVEVLGALSVPDDIRQGLAGAMRSDDRLTLDTAARSIRELIRRGCYPDLADVPFPSGQAGEFLRAAHALRPGRSDAEIALVLRSADPRAVTLALLGLDTPAFEGVEAELDGASRSSDPAMRALALLRMNHEKHAAASARRRLNDPHPLVRIAARLVLSRTGSEPPSLEDLADACSAARALGDGLSLELDKIESIWRKPTSTDDRQDQLSAAFVAAMDGSIIRRVRGVDEQSESLVRPHKSRLHQSRVRLGRSAAKALDSPSTTEIGRIDALKTLAWDGQRIDVPRLIREWHRGTSVLRAEAANALAELTGRSPAAFDNDNPTNETWWAERAFALRIPRLVLVDTHGDPD